MIPPEPRPPRREPLVDVEELRRQVDPAGTPEFQDHLAELMQGIVPLAELLQPARPEPPALPPPQPLPEHALARFGGLRCPSEVLSLEWRHVDWERGRLTVPSPKTDRYDGKESRTIPLFPELRRYLEEAFELAEPGQAHVIGGDHLAKATRPTGWKSCNLRTTFGKLVKRAGLEPWPRLFHNLRSSRETELLEQFPVHVVALWMGHDAKVSLKHYAQTTDEHFERATRTTEGGAKSGALVAQNAAQQTAAGSGSELQTEGANDDGLVVYAASCDSLQHTAHVFSGEGGIRTRGRVLPLRRFSKAVLSTTQPPLRTSVSYVTVFCFVNPPLKTVGNEFAIGE
jgi:hypothetical protein